MDWFDCRSACSRYPVTSQVGPEQMYIRQLWCDHEYLFFPYKDKVYAYSFRKGRIAARMGGFSGSVEGLDSRRLGVVVSDDVIVMYWGTQLIVCDRHDFEQHSFRVKHQYADEWCEYQAQTNLSSLCRYSLSDVEIRKVSIIAEHLVICVNVPVTVDDNSEDKPVKLEALAAEMRIILPGEDDLEARFMLPHTSGPVVATKFSKAQGADCEGRYVDCTLCWPISNRYP